jgi:hypothetical protein
MCARIDTTRGPTVKFGKMGLRCALAAAVTCASAKDRFIRVSHRLRADPPCMKLFFPYWPRFLTRSHPQRLADDAAGRAGRTRFCRNFMSTVFAISVACSLP